MKRNALSNALRTEDDDFRVFLDYVSGIDSVELLSEIHEIPEFSVEIILDVYLTEALEGESSSYRSNPGLTDDQQKEIIEKYQSGMSLRLLAAAYSVSPMTIQKLLVLKGVARRSSGRAKGQTKLTDDQQKKIIEKYQSGMTMRSLAAEYNVAAMTINNILTKKGIDTRSRGAQAALSDEQSDDIAKKYSEEKRTQTSLAEEYDVAPTTIDRLLTKKGIEKHIAKPQGILSDEQKTEIAKRYTVDKESLPSLARAYGVAVETIRRVLIDKGIVRRPSNFQKRDSLKDPSRTNPIPFEHQRSRHIGFADEEPKAFPRVEEDWDRNCDGETYENLDLRHINFTDASLVGTSFINCDMRGLAFLGSNISHTNFQGSNLSNTNFKFIERLDHVNFEFCNLSGAIFGERGDYTDCNWNNTNIEKTNFRDRSFLFMFLRIKKDPNLSIFIHGTPTFKHINLIGANLPSANLQGLDLRGANLSANLQGANLQGANLQGANLEFAELQGANLQGADLRGANLEFARLEFADLRGAKYNRLTKGLTRTDITNEQKSVMLEVVR